jgi:hypothetical protein
LFKGYGAKVGLGNMRVKAENRMVTPESAEHETFQAFRQVSKRRRLSRYLLPVRV